MKITALKVNHVTSPIGYQADKFTFSYKVEEAEGKRSTGARIVIAADETGKKILYDTGMTDTINSLGQTIPLTVQPRTRYFWWVEVNSDADEHAKSDIAFFETGKIDEPWTAKWITCDSSEKRHPIFTKKFAAGKEVVSSRLYISGLGLYEAHINGKRVGKEVLTPYCTDYNSWVQYQTYDVSDLLEEENALTVELGQGWYLGRYSFTSAPDDPGHFGKDYKLIAELHILYADGSEDVIGTDESFEVTRSKIIFSNIYDGEQRDDTLEALPPVPAMLLPEEEVKKLHLSERLSLPVYEQEELKPVLITTPAGEKVFDLGQNIAGSFKLNVHVKSGTRIHVQVGEVLQGGNFYRDNLRTARAEYIYISDGTPVTLSPKFTFYGYRYAKVEGIDDLSENDFTGIAYYSDVKPAGQFVSGDDKLNQLMSNISWGQKGNFIDVPTDCPQRDERMGWTADTQVFVPTACYLTDSYAFYRKFLYDLRMEQKRADGRIPNVIPSFDEDGFSSVWGDACTIMPWTLYVLYGDIEILKESLTSMCDWVDFISRVDGDNHHYREVFHYGDWVALDHPSGSVDEVRGGTEEGYIADTYYLNSALLIVKAAKVLLENSIDVEKNAEYNRIIDKYSALAKKIKEELLKEYFSPNGRCVINTQTACVLALYYDLTCDRDRMTEKLLDLLKWNNNHFKTGFVGTPLISRVLTQEGHSDIAYEIIHNEEYPGWLYEINLGATTVWERWNSMNADGSVSSTGMNSFNHYAYGSIGQWMWETMAGIQPCEDTPGFKKVQLKPVPDSKTKFVHAVYDSPAGTYKTGWEMDDTGHIHVYAEIPFDCTAEMALPFCKDRDKSLVLCAGKYEWDYERVTDH